MKALIIVDVQNDFCPGGSLAVNDGDQVVPIINRLATDFPLVVASKDWHPETTIHFEKWPVHCVRESHGAAFHPELNTDPIRKVFFKGTENKDDGYSAFEATNDDLAQYLQQHEVTDLFVSGLATDYCVKATAIDATKNGFKVYLIEDAAKGVEVNHGDTEAAVEEMRNAGVIITQSKELYSQ